MFDVNSNRVVEVDKEVYDIIQDFEDKGEELLLNRYKDVYPPEVIKKNFQLIRDTKQEQGLFSSFRPDKITLGARRPEHIKKIHSHGLQQLLLELTRDCNLKCCYCNVSGKYAPKNPPALHMSPDLCIKAVDFFLDKASTSQVQAPAVSFYGGEPLLKFDLIKEVVHYVEKKWTHGNCGFSLTTNGTLINKEMIDFFAGRDFSIMVSLDGPREIHDRYRVSKDGRSSFDRVMENLKFIKQYNYDYYSKNVSIFSVLTPPFQIHDIIDFFMTDKTLEPLRKAGKIRATLVDTAETSFEEDFNLSSGMKEFRDVYDTLVERLKKLIIENKYEEIIYERVTIYTILFNIARRASGNLFEQVTPKGACHIGLRRVFVSTAGDFYICERAGYRYNIGNINSGFDYDRIAGYYRKLEEVLEDCRYCWALNYCERCWVQLGNLDDFSGEQKETFCKGQKKVILEALRAYVDLLNQDPDCLKRFFKHDKKLSSPRT